MRFAKLTAVLAMMMFVLMPLAVIAPSAEADTDVEYHEVIFYDIYGDVLKRCMVADGGSALPPTAPDFADRHFIGWDKDYKNVKRDMEIRPMYSASESSDANLRNPDSTNMVAIRGKEFGCTIKGSDIYESSWMEDRFNGFRNFADFNGTRSSVRFPSGTSQTLNGSSSLVGSDDNITYVTMDHDNLICSFVPKQLGDYVFTIIVNYGTVSDPVWYYDTHVTTITWTVHVDETDEMVSITFNVDGKPITRTTQKFGSLDTSQLPTDDEINSRLPSGFYFFAWDSYDESLLNNIEEDLTFNAILYEIGYVKFLYINNEDTSNPYDNKYVLAGQPFGTGASGEYGEGKYYLYTNPSDATLAITSGNENLNNSVKLGKEDGKWYVYSDRLDVKNPGTYWITITATAHNSQGNEITGKMNLAFIVPIIVTSPVNQVSYVGDTVTYDINANPKNDVYTEVTSITLDGNPLTSNEISRIVGVNGTRITARWSEVGLYEIEYKLTHSTYAPYIGTWKVQVAAAEDKPNTLSLSRISVSNVTGSSSSFYFVALGASQSNCYWDFGNGDTAQNTLSTIYDYKQSGIYTVKFRVYNPDDENDYIEKSTEIMAIVDGDKGYAFYTVPYTYFMEAPEGYDDSSDSVPSWLTVKTEVSSETGKKYIKIYGTPNDESYVGKTYTISVAGQSWTVEVLEKQSREPVASFVAEANGLTVKLYYHGRNASMARYDIGDGRGFAYKPDSLKDGSEFIVTYEHTGMYTITLYVKNNLGEDEYSQTVNISTDVMKVSLSDITDQICKVNTKFAMALDVPNGTVISFSGADWLVYDQSTKTLSGTPRSASVYNLKLTAVTDQAESTVNFKITVSGNDSGGSGGSSDNPGESQKSFWDEHAKHIICGIIAAVAVLVLLFYPEPMGKAVAAVVAVASIIGGFFL